MATNVRFEKYFSRNVCGLKQDTVDAGRILMGDQILKTLVIRFILYKIDIFGVHQKNRYPLVFAEVGQVFFLNVGEVFGGDVLFKRAVAFGDLGEQPFGTGVEVEDQVGFRQDAGDGVEDTLEERELVLGEVVLGEEQAFVDEIVAEDKVGEEVAGGEQPFELLVAVHEEGHLHGEGVMLRILVELLQEGVVCEPLQHQFGVEVAGQHGGEGRLARADAAFHDNIVIGYFHGEQWLVNSEQ